ncbi:hypothetical protein SUGI_0946760 [Cryptomeria japonica]|nr:hypothetical protein SUGI_0946760 [Cryptomeria japonica]
MSLPNDCFLIEFLDGNERWNTLNRGPFMLDGIGVHLIDLQSNFNPRTNKLPGCLFWVRLYNIPSEYWNTEVLKEIGNCFGSFISVDEILEDRIWGSFARICVNIDQISSMPDKIRIMGNVEGWTQRIDREDQMFICPKCFLREHIGVDCVVSTRISRAYSCTQMPKLPQVDNRVKEQSKVPSTISKSPKRMNDVMDNDVPHINLLVEGKLGVFDILIIPSQGTR